MRYICIDRRRKQYPVRMMCRVLKVSRSGYYAWRVRPESQRAKTDRELTREIRRIHIDSDGVYGAPKITAELKEEGHQCGRHKVTRLMRKAGLKGCPKLSFKVTTQRDPSHPVADNLLEQDFTAEGPNERWASDITYISTHQGWLFLAVVMDLCSRRIVGWSMGRWINRHLVIDALNMAIGQRCPEGELLHHSDRGSQYTSDDFRDELDKHGIQCSMSARGNCYDNAVVESFFGWLVEEQNITPHVPVWDKSAGKDELYGRTDFSWEAEADRYLCPGGKPLLRNRRKFKKKRTGITKAKTINYRASQSDCGHCPMKARCCPGKDPRKIARSVHEDARDLTRALATTKAYAQSSKNRKKVEMLFAHMKKILKVDRLRLRGMNGAHDEFLLTAAAQNLRRMAQWLGTGPPGALAGAVP